MEHSAGAMLLILPWNIPRNVIKTVEIYCCKSIYFLSDHIQLLKLRLFNFRAKRKSEIQARNACWESLVNAINLLASPSKLFACVFHFSALLCDNLN